MKQETNCSEQLNVNIQNVSNEKKQNKEFQLFTTQMSACYNIPSHHTYNFFVVFALWRDSISGDLHVNRTTF